jgi:BirA family biotin operon repressor/biotin-[acetyl-CoA-carboxylase] ligase
MQATHLTAALAGLPLGPLRFFKTISSTNDEAARWVELGAPDLALVFADEQTAGRGRAGRRWFTPAGSALAFSLVLRFDWPVDLSSFLAGISALGSLAVSDALIQHYALAAQIKWPNDVLVNRKKLAGILAEAYWQGDRLGAVILGIGVNVTSQAVPPPDSLIYPATSVQGETDQPVDRLELLHQILSALLIRRSSLGADEFLCDWEDRLAFRGEWVQITQQEIPLEGRLIGVKQDGALRLVTPAGQEVTVYTGDVSLRPLEPDC